MGSSAAEGGNREGKVREECIGDKERNHAGAIPFVLVRLSVEKLFAFFSLSGSLLRDRGDA